MTPELDYKAAAAVLAKYIQDDGGLFSLGRYLSWNPGTDEICLDSYFTADELSAIVYWMKYGHKQHTTSSVSPVDTPR